MLRKAGGLGMVALMVLLLPVIAWLTFSFSEVGMAQDIGLQSPVITSGEYAVVPQSVVDSAVTMAAELVGDNQEKLQDIVDQLLTVYKEAKGKDFVVVFNSGGWGWNISRSSGWSSILDGIKLQLGEEGYQTLVLSYRRTSSGVAGVIREFFEAASSYPRKAKDLATRIEFLTENLPDLRVIIAGESTGTVISDSAMTLLKDQPRVYSIRTGTPFWHKPATLDRTLLMNDNGLTTDTFSYGDVPALVYATVKSWFGISSDNDKPGDILFWLKAPGHDYSWQYPGVYDSIVKFIKGNFGSDN